MTALVVPLLALAVLAVWIAAVGFCRLRTALERLLAVTFLNVAGGAPVVLAAWLTDGPTVRAAKCTAVWLATLVVGALLGHVTGHALHIRDGERR